MYRIDPDTVSYHRLDLGGLTRLSWRHRYAAPSEDELRPFLVFLGREDYLAWVDAWKRTYRAIASDIRALKAELHRPHDELDDPVRLMGHREQARTLARTLLALRHAGRRESQRQRARATESTA